MNMQERSKVLVVGATGTVGGAAARALVASGAQVRALVRSPERAKQLAGVEIMQGDLADPAALRQALTGVQTALYVSPHETNEVFLAETFIALCEELGLRLVFIGVHVDGRTRFSRAVRRFLLGRLLSTYKPKAYISERARNSKTNCIVLMPTNFFDNDVIFREELLGGRFVQPFERPINRVAVRDIGEAAARACLDSTLPSGAYPVVGPVSLDGAACASVWSEALGRNVTYQPDNELFRAAVARSLTGKKASDFVSSYAAIRNFELPTSKQDLARTTSLLGRPPTSYAEYVKELAEQWNGSHKLPHAPEPCFNSSSVDQGLKKNHFESSGFLVERI